MGSNVNSPRPTGRTAEPAPHLRKRHFGGIAGQQGRQRSGSAVEPEHPFEALGRQAGSCTSLCREWTNHSARYLWSSWRIAVALGSGLGSFCHTAATSRRANLSRSSCVRWARRTPPALASKACVSWEGGLMVGSLIGARSMVARHVWGSRFPDRTVCGLTSLGNRLTCQAGKLVRALQAGAQGIGIVWNNRHGCLFSSLRITASLVFLVQLFLLKRHLRTQAEDGTMI